MAGLLSETKTVTFALKQRPEICFKNHENFLKKKIAKQATANLIDFFFKSFNKKKIYAKTKTDNYINLNLNSKLGFIIKDHDRKFYIMELTNVRFYNFYLKKR